MDCRIGITVGANTGLNGAVIASAAPAANNVLTTQTLTTSDIENKAEYKAVTVGLSASTSGGMRPPSVGASSGSASGTTKSAIGEGTIIVKADAVTGSDSVAGLNRDTSGANGSIEKIFDQKKVEEQQELGKVFGEQAFRAVGDIAQQYTKAYDNASLQLSNAQAYQELKDKESDGTLSQSERATLSAMESSGFTPAIASELAATANATLSDPQVQADYENWKEGSVNKTLLHALAGGMQAGLSGGNISAAALGAGSSEALKDLSKDLPPDLQQWVSTIAGAGAGALAGGGEGAVSGASSAQDGEVYNRQLHTIEEKLISDNAAEYAKQNGIKIEAAIAQLRAQALRQVDRGSADIPNNPSAAAFLTKIALAAGNQNVGGGGLFDARNSVSYYDARINSVSANNTNNVTVAQTVAAASRSNIPGAKDAIPKEGEAITIGVNVILAAEGGVGIVRAAPSLWARITAFFTKDAASGAESALAANEAAAAGHEIGTITTRTTKNTTRLGGEAGEPGVNIKYRDGTEFDMTATRVKQTELNPYVPGGTRPIKFEDALNKQGTKRAPTKEELDWFNSISH